MLTWQTMVPRAWIFLLCFASIHGSAQSLGVDLDGRSIDRLASPGVRAIVLFFAASDCPISNRYIPEIERLDREFSPAGVHFWWVYPNPADTAAVVRQHRHLFDIHGDVLLDLHQRVTTMAHANVTPEVAVFIPAGAGLREVYRGRVDDRYVSLGQERPSAEKHDLEDALRALTTNRPVPAPGGPPIGCSIVPRGEL